MAEPRAAPKACVMTIVRPFLKVRPRSMKAGAALAVAERPPTKPAGAAARLGSGVRAAAASARAARRVSSVFCADFGVSSVVCADFGVSFLFESFDGVYCIPLHVYRVAMAMNRQDGPCRHERECLGLARC